MGPVIPRVGGRSDPQLRGGLAPLPPGPRDGSPHPTTPAILRALRPGPNCPQPHLRRTFRRPRGMGPDRSFRAPAFARHKTGCPVGARSPSGAHQRSIRILAGGSVALSLAAPFSPARLCDEAFPLGDVLCRLGVGRRAEPHALADSSACRASWAVAGNEADQA